MQFVIENLSVRRGVRQVITALSFQVSGGEAMIVRGANGSGKTTLLRALAGFLPAHSGQISISTRSEDGETVAECCHYVGHLNAIKASQTVAENVQFFARYLDPDATPSERNRRIADALERCALTNLKSIPCGYLSAGQKRRLGLSRLLCAHRPIWLLDEPTTSLDQASSERLTTIMADHLSTGGLIVAATHLDLNLKQQRTLKLDHQTGGV